MRSWHVCDATIAAFADALEWRTHRPPRRNVCAALELICIIASNPVPLLSFNHPPLRNSMPKLRRFYEGTNLHYISCSTYRRTRAFDSERFKFAFVDILRELRSELEFKLVGYVLMPEHFHMLIWPSPMADPSRIMQSLKERTALYVLDQLRKNQQFPWCQKALSRFRLPPSYHGHAKCRVWQKRSFDMNIYSEKKRLEKLDYMHANPVKRRLVKEPGDWPWSSWRFYYLGDTSLLAMDHVE
jgi:putative transposase